MYGYDVWIFGIIAVFIISLIAQSSLKSTFRKYSKIPASSGMSAYDVATGLLFQNGSSVTVKPVGGDLTDHFNPKTGEVGLSQTVYGERSIAALAVAAHEIGHVMQYQDGYIPIKIRNSILPVARIGSQAAPFIVVLGLILSSYTLAMIGVYLFSAMFIFQVVTLPVEFNASNRALEMLTENGYISYEERKGARKVLRCAANTYVVAALASLMSLLRLYSLASRSRRS